MEEIGKRKVRRKYSEREGYRKNKLRGGGKERKGRKRGGGGKGGTRTLSG